MRAPAAFGRPGRPKWAELVPNNYTRGLARRASASADHFCVAARAGLTGTKEPPIFEF